MENNINDERLMDTGRGRINKGKITKVDKELLSPFLSFKFYWSMLIHNFVLVSGVQQDELLIHIQYIYKYIYIYLHSSFLDSYPI